MIVRCVFAADASANRKAIRVSRAAKSIYRYLTFSLGLAAQYFFIRTLTAFLAAADIFERLRRRWILGSSTASGIAGLTADP